MAQRARWVIKIGSALLTNDGRGLDRDLMQVWVDRMVALRERGIDVMVVSSGAVAEALGERTEQLGSTQQALIDHHGLLRRSGRGKIAFTLPGMDRHLRGA